MSKRLRVHQLAKELGYSKQELVSKINDLDLSTGSVSIMTVLTDEDVDKIKSALKSKTSRSASNGAAAAAAPAPVKRRKKDDAKDDGDDDDIGPKVRRRSKSRRRRTISVNDDHETSVKTEEIESAPESEEQEDEAVEAEVAQAPEAPEPQEEAEVEEAPEVAEDTEEAEHEEADAEDEAPEAADEAPEEEVEVEADEEVEEETDEAQEAAEAAEDEAAEQEDVEDEDVDAQADEADADDDAEETADDEEAEADDEDEDEVEEAAAPAPTPESKKPAQKGSDDSESAAKKKKGAAQVLGRIDLGTMTDRLGDRDFDPPSKKKKKKRKSKRNNDDRKSGRRVRNVESLYLDDQRRRRKQKRRKSKGTEITTAAEHKRVVRIEDTITVGELGKEMGVKAGRLALKLMEMGLQATVNTTLDFDTAQLIAMEFDHTVENVAFDITQFYDTDADSEETLQTRPPVVTVMGHVDHGKTSLLDSIRASTITSTEAGGITQHIGAYTVQPEEGGQITFLDTPGHEAFTALRARGAQATDIVVLVVAADDGVMPQTVEAINHSRDAGVPIIVAVNKIDKPAANPDRVKTALSEYELIPEEWGGDTQFVEVSALQATNIDELLEQIVLRAEISELKANPKRTAQGLVIESQLDTGRGPVATMLVQRGTLKVGDIVVVSEHYGRVRTMADHRGDEIEEAGPSIPVEITGLGGVPEAGEPFFVIEEERDAKMITGNVAEQRRQKRMAALSKSGMDKLRTFIEEGIQKKLKVIIKGDVQGSLEALSNAFVKIGNDEVSIEVIHAAVGGVTENDVNLAASSEDAVVIVGFNVRADSRAQEVAEKYDVTIFNFNVIYDAIDALRNLVEGMLAPLKQENVLGQAEVRETFHAPKVGTIAGCYVTQGLLRRNARARLYRDGKLVYDSLLASLRRFKDDVREVQSGYECGTSLENFNDIKVGDVIEVYEINEVAATLD